MSSILNLKKIHCLQIVMKNLLSKLHHVFGSTVGIGLSLKKPSKQNLLVFCMIGCVMISVELPEEVTGEAFQSGIELSLNETIQGCILS